MTVHESRDTAPTIAAERMQYQPIPPTCQHFAANQCLIARSISIANTLIATFSQARDKAPTRIPRVKETSEVKSPGLVACTDVVWRHLHRLEKNDGKLRATAEAESSRSSEHFLAKNFFLGVLGAPG
ncbi:MAG: hypothetical protein ACREX3_15150 [Gammaproteobacteria bacterium]